ncbi:polyphosphate kinase [Leptospira perolatii]|uniref:Polyphosphate kinase n=1 Tax=Leptospira perolatii TaxID=2023191 RepID=A0A2M9ZPV8_9LEPT|nr:PPK2 family polyphosphate kinase [Leptospira perolatii]PJZ70931.1 polyphosphate kinase [Leptospira perolatii]PJZ74055.1 polyphosphate kinase [Leptospira perolatii]
MELDKIQTKAPEDVSQEWAEKEIEKLQKELFDLQNLFFAAKKFSMLVLFQGVDASGKDGTIRHVFSCMNPLGVRAKAFKVPNEVELEHDFLWRIFKELPEKGIIQIFNRSYYEDIIEPSIAQNLDKEILENRYDTINALERHLIDNGTILLKFYLHISSSEQKHRIRKRISDPMKNWKYSESDEIAANHYEKYLEAYDRVIKKCSKHSSWHVLPSDDKWYRNYKVAKTIAEHIERLDLSFPKRQR